MSPLSINSGEYKSRIGLDSLFVAEVTADGAAAYTAGTPEVFAPAAEASQEPATSFEIQYADDQPYDVMTGEGATKITIQVTNVPPEMMAWITGKVFDSVSGRVWDDKAEAPYFALGFRSLKSNGKYRYYWFLKGKFDMPKEDTATKGESPEPKTLSLTYTAIFTTYQFDVGAVNNNVKRVFGDEDTTNFSAATWFSQVQTPSVVAPSALALSSSVPTDDATGISVSANQTLTFNNALIDDAIYEVVLTKFDGTVVTMAANYPQLDTTKKIMTLDPASNLIASTLYLISYAVTDIYGQHLVGVVSFTTA